MLKRGDKKDRNFYLLPKNRKGISSVIVTILIIGISLAAIAVVAVVIRGLISQGTSFLGLGQITISLKIQNVNIAADAITVYVTRNSGEGNLSGIAFVLANGTEARTVNQNVVLNQLDTRSFSISLGEVDISDITKVSIAPIFTTISGATKVGDIQDTYSLPSQVSGTGQENQNQGTGCIPACSFPRPFCDSNSNCDECLQSSDCSSFGQGYTCNNGNCIPPDSGCSSCAPPTPICDLFNMRCVECSQDSDCNSYGTGYTCNNGVCKAPNCVYNGPNPCGTRQCGTQYDSTCGNPFNCGLNNGNCPNANQFCNSDGSCVDISPIRTGTVQDVWPPGVNVYFSSQNLYNQTGTFAGDYITFAKGSAQSTDNGCLLITTYQSLNDQQSKSFAGFSFETSIQTGNTFSIWIPSQRPQICI